MNDFRPFNYAQSVQSGTQNALGQMQAMQVAEKINQAPAERNYLIQQRDEQKIMQSLDKQIKQYSVLQTGADQVLKGNGQGYEMFRTTMEDLRISNPGELPERYNKELMMGLSGQSEEKIKGLKEIYDAESPTGTRIVRASDAVGKPGKMGKGMNIDFGPEGRVSRISTGGKGQNTPLPKRVHTKQVEKVIGAGERLARLKRIKKIYNPKFLTYKGKAQRFISNIKSKADIDMSPEERGALRDHRRFTQAVQFEFNAYRKEITGAAAAFSELKTLMKAMMNVNLSPEEFEASYNEYSRELSRSMRIKNRLIREGLNPGTQQFGENLDGLYLTGDDDSVDARGDELAAQGLGAEQIVDQLEDEGYI